MRAELALTACLLVACQGGFIEDAEPPLRGLDQQGARGDGGISGPSKPGEPTKDCAPRANARLVLLSELQQLTTVRALMGQDALVGDDLPTSQLKPFAQKGLVVNTSLVHTRNEWAHDAAEAKPPSATELGCTTLDAACAERYLRKLAPRAFRRPVEDEEIRDLMEVYALAAEESPAHGLQRAIEAVLAAPSLAFRRELGSAPKNGVRALDGHELASVISYALTDGPPDDALWAAAQDGSLAEPKVQRAQITRLLADAKVQNAVTGTLLASWGLGNIFGAAKDPTLFPTFTPQLIASMYHETELMVSDTLWTRASPLTELLSTPRTFVDAQLATLYGVKAPSKAFGEVTLPEGERAGLLTQASVLAMLARSDTTSVVARGLFVRGLLCMSKVPSPPESLTTAISDLLKQDLSERERAEVRAANPTCGGCHAGIDPYGLLLEKYDALGRYREELDGKPIDSSVMVAKDNYADAMDFLRTATERDDFGACVGTRVLSYALSDDALKPSDCQVEDALAGADLQSVTMEELVQRMLSTPSIAYRNEEAP